MTGPAPAGRDLTILDVVCAVMDRPRRPLDFTVMVDVPRTLSLDDLRVGARSACRRYPVAGAWLAGGRWRPAPEMADAGVRSGAAGTDATQALRTFVDEPFDLRGSTPIRQMRVDVDGRTILASRFHHAAADGTSAAAWLSHQLGVALGERPAAQDWGRWDAPTVRVPRHDGGRRRHAASAHLWRRPGSPARARRWRTVEVEAPDDPARFWRAGFTYSDLLATLTLEALDAWNRSHRAGEPGRVGLWLPVSVRATGDTAFGNGTSRVRVHASYPAHASLSDKCVDVHRQIARALRAGEWQIPAAAVPRRLASGLGARLLRGYLARPWADVGTASFSHVDRWCAPPAAVFDCTSAIACVSSLHSQHPLAVTGVTRRRRTWLTVTYDPSWLTDEDAVAFADSLRDRHAIMRRTLACAA